MTVSMIFVAIRLAAAAHAALAPCAGLPLGRWAVCQEVAAAARAEFVPVEVAVTLAWSESRFERDAESPAGALGPLQVIPAYWCPAGMAAGCDLTRAGAIALRLLTARHGLERGLCHYASGNVCKPRALRYARFVLSQAASGRRPW